MIFFTDIDGTLLNQNSEISRENFNALKQLDGFIRVAITGRNLFSAKRVLPADTPIDYLVFSNGAGITDWRSGELIYSQNLEPGLTAQLVDFLRKTGVTFTVHAPVPDSHIYWFYTGNHIPADLESRNELYKPFVRRLDSSFNGKASSIICMLSENEDDFNRLAGQLEVFKPQITVTRTTSPINHRNIWLEIYPAQVNKGKTARYLCDYLGVGYDKTIGVGNDYNDLSLLEFVRYPFVVENAPGELKERFPVLPHHNDNAIAHLLRVFPRTNGR